LIQITVDILKFGKLGLTSAAYDAFEVIYFKSGTKGVAVARIEVEKSDHPELRVLGHDARELPSNHGRMATVENAVLGNWSDEVSTHFALTASGADDAMELVLSGRRKHHNFWWRSQVKIMNGEVMIQGPTLASDLHS
jgi:hypothetical protein